MPQPIKKRKHDSSSTNDFKVTRQKIRELEAGLSDKTKLNNLVDIFEYTRSENAQVVHAAIHALHRSFTRMLANEDLRREKSQDMSSPKNQVGRWLREQYNDFLLLLRSLLSNDEPGLQVPALNIQMALLKSESEYAHAHNKSTTFANDFYVPIVESVIRNRNFSQPLFKEFVEKYLNVYDDLRHYFYKNAADFMEAVVAKPGSEPARKRPRLTSALSQDSRRLVAQNVFSIVEAIRSMPTEASEIDTFWAVDPSSDQPKQHSKESQVQDDDMDALLGGGLMSDDDDQDNQALEKSKSKSQQKTIPILVLRVHQRSFTLCWVAMLRLPLTDEIYKKTLVIMHKRVLPHMSDPKLLMDFLTDSYNVGGSISLLALNGVFTLIAEHNLDYPDFYHKLYSLLDRDVMHVKYRSRFFRLLDTFLASAYLPATLVAAFIKRLARLSLTAPPAASVIIIPFIYNLLKRHPTCMKLIHNNSAVSEAEDPYNFEEMNPYECQAIDSSLWEMQTLAQHFYANVSTLAKIFTEQFIKPKYNLEDFLDHTYATFFTTEINRKSKKEPALAIEKSSACVWEI